MTASVLFDAESHPCNAEFKRASLLHRYRSIRSETASLCQPLATEDYVIQGMDNVSPPRWHLAHTSWFFEHFILAAYASRYREFNPEFGYLFNSYYLTVGQFFPRHLRGHLSRPTVAEVYAYRHHVDSAMERLIETASDERLSHWLPLLELGLQHEQQHQELLLTDIKFNFSLHPSPQAYRKRDSNELAGDIVMPLRWTRYPGGVRMLGHDGTGFAYDNETPRHEVLLRNYRLANRLVTNAEYLEFMADGGYQRPELWLSDGWTASNSNAWQAPLYWLLQDGQWHTLTLHGMQAVVPAEPVCHVSFYEADAYARWCHKRLPSEGEWENAAVRIEVDGNFRETGSLHPVPCDTDAYEPLQLFGDVWEWTQSPYAPYPGFVPLTGSVGEYNGKFMCNQWVLRGGSCVSPRKHLRASYRNFFYPADRWQFTGIRLAEDDHA